MHACTLHAHMHPHTSHERYAKHGATLHPAIAFRGLCLEPCSFDFSNGGFQAEIGFSYSPSGNLATLAVHYRYYNSLCRYDPRHLPSSCVIRSSQVVHGSSAHSDKAEDWT